MVELKTSAIRTSLAASFGAVAMQLLAPAIASAEILRFKMDPDQCIVSAAVAEPAAFIRGSATGMFHVIDGEIIGDPKNIPATAKARVLIDATSYRSDSSMRDRAVTSKALEAGRFPTIAFATNSIVGVVETGQNRVLAIANGFLTLHGESRAMTFPVQASLDANGTLVADGEVKFHYEDYGVKVPSVLFGAIVSGDEVTLRFHVVATAQEQAPAALVAPTPARSAPPAR
jgi:polyisoprenoid-binding protein YceI